MRRRLLAPLLALAAVAGCGGQDRPDRPLPAARGAMALRSAAFADGARIPERYTCVGEDVSPPLSWRGVPARARELALVVEDPDAGRFVHWSVLGIAPRAGRVGAGEVPPGATQTENSFGDRRWGGPCPPKGEAPHRYVFALYASDAPLALGTSASQNAIRARLAEHAIARGVLTGRFGR